MMASDIETPRVFISYSWSSPQHEQWIINLATELCEEGVDVILDKWELKEGYDAIAFMEKMVTDPEIKKVVIISDKIYAQKADDRKGGVGTETQIISKEIYDKVEQDKFVVVIVEKDEKGEPYLPTYYKSRIYIDLSEPDNYTENFERLLRWIYNEPLYKKPEIGKKPSFLSKSKQISLGTTVSFRRTINAIKDGKSYAAGALDEYFDIFLQNLEKFRIKNLKGKFDKDEFCQVVINNIEAFLPYRNEVIQIFSAIAKYNTNKEFFIIIHRFFESFIPYMFKPENVNQYRKWDFDNFKFIVHELFLYFIAIFLNLERFQQISGFLNQRYYIPGESYYGNNVMVSFSVFRQHIESLENENNIFNLDDSSLRTDLLKKRCQTTGIDFRYLIQADFVLFMRTELQKTDSYDMWFPDIIVDLHHMYGPLEIFARAESNQYFEKIKCLLNIESPNDLKQLVDQYQQGKRKLPQRGIFPSSITPEILLNIEKLSSLP